MSLNFNRVLAAGVALGLTGTAFGQGVNIDAPENAGNFEFTGLKTTLTIDVDANGSTDGNLMVATEVVDYFFQIIGVQDGSTTTLWPETQIPGGTNIDFDQNGTFDDAGAVPLLSADFQVDIDLDFPAFASAVTAAQGAAAIDPSVTDIVVVIRVKDQTGNINDTEITETSGALTAAGEAADLDTTAVTISSVFLDAGNEKFFVEFSRAFRFTGGDEGVNGTSSGVANTVGLGHIRLGADDTFAPPIAVTGILANLVDYVTGSDSTFEFDQTGNFGNIVVGQFLRVEGANPLSDVLGNDPNTDTNGAEVTALTTFAIQSAEAIASVTGVAAGQQAFRVIYNLPIDATDLGDDAFYGDVIMKSGAVTTIDIPAVAGIAVDPNNSSAVLVTADFGTANDLLWADGLATDGGSYSFETDFAGGNPPSSIFGSTITADSTTTITDGIAPSIDDFAWHDLDSDGEMDACSIIFDEPVTPNGVTAANFTLDLVNVNVQPFSQITGGGLLVTDATAVAADEVTITSITAESVEMANTAGAPTRIETGNAVTLNFDPAQPDWDGDGNTGAADTDGEAIPGTGGPSALELDYDNGGSFDDANGNSTTTGVIGNESIDTDRAPAILALGAFFTGDNQVSTTNNQYLREIQSGNTGTNPAASGLGDQLGNNRLGIFASEDFAGAPTSLNTVEESITYGPNGTPFSDGDVFNGGGFGFANGAVLGFNGPTADLAAGNTFNVGSGAGWTDVSGNAFTVSNATIANAVAPYLPFSQSLDGGVDYAAFLVDSDSDGFADECRMTMNQEIDGTTLDVTDFGVAGFGGVITNVSLDGSNAKVIILTFTDGQISMTSTIDVTYNGTTDASLINSDTTAGEPGVATSNVDATFEAKDVVAPDAETQGVAIMPIVGNITIGGAPAPRGTKLFAMNAIPVVKRATATHNNVRWTQSFNDDSNSMEAFTNVLLGIEPFIYLHRDSDNYQFYRNGKDHGSTTLGDVIGLTLNTRSFSNVTFQGNGETSGDKVTNGKLEICWDVMRASSPDLESFYSNGYEWYGAPIFSATVITSDDGSYSLHHSGPIAAFNGRSTLDALDLPVIMVVETPDGTRSVCSSLLTSVDMANHEGGPLLFTANNRTQVSGSAPDATRFDINLDYVGTQITYPGWNLEGFPRVGGWVRAAGNRPALPAGITTDDVFVGTGLPAVSPLDQFVFWYDSDDDGIWNQSDDSSDLLDNIVLSSGCFPNFWFNMTSFGVQMGSSATNMVGGYGFGFFNNDGSDYGFFQFGAPLSSGAIFGSGDFKNSSSNQGWFLGTNTTAYDPATGFFSANADSDYIITFDNQGSGDIDVSSHANGAAGNPNNTASVEDGQPLFVHIEN